MLNPDYRDMLSALSEEGVEFLLVGAYALAVHGVPRATGDLDLWVRPTEENAHRAWAALARFGAPLQDLTERDLATPGVVFQVGVAPRRIDLLTDIDGLVFDEAWMNHVDVTVAGLRIPVLSRDDLLKNKRASGRPQDVADIARLEDGSEV